MLLAGKYRDSEEILRRDRRRLLYLLALDNGGTSKFHKEMVRLIS